MEKSLRLDWWLVIRDGFDISQAAATMWQLREKDDDAIYQTLIRRGAVPAEGERLVAYLPLAFGRVLLRGLNIRFSDSATLMNPDTNASVAINLAEEPIFGEALRLAEEAYTQGTMSREQFGFFAFRSPEVDAVNQALKHGSRPEDLVCSPPIVFCSSMGEASA